MTVITLADIVQAVQDGNGPVAAQHLLELTGARATGLWKLDGESLHQLGFTTVPEMHAATRAEFAALTRTVLLSHDGLGIVQAVLKREPVMARRHQGPMSLGTSATWLDRFDAACSLSYPCFSESGTVTGIVALAHVEVIDETHPAWQSLQELAALLGPQL